MLKSVSRMMLYISRTSALNGSVAALMRGNLRPILSLRNDLDVGKPNTSIFTRLGAPGAWHEPGRANPEDSFFGMLERLLHVVHANNFVKLATQE